MEYSEIANLSLPDDYDDIDVSVLSGNFEKLDGIIKFLLAKVGYNNRVELKIRSAQINNFYPITTVKEQKYFNCTAVFIVELTAAGAAIYKKGTSTITFPVYPFGDNGTWISSVTGVAVCICAKYNISSNDFEFVGYGKYTENISGMPDDTYLRDGTPVKLTDGTILFPIAEFEIDTEESSIKSYPISVYTGDVLEGISVLI